MCVFVFVCVDGGTHGCKHMYAHVCIHMYCVPCVFRLQNVGANEPGHGATEVMDENLSQEDGEEPLKKATNDQLIIPVDPMNKDVDNRVLEEQGLMALTPKDIVLDKNHLGKYEAEQKGKEALDVDNTVVRSQPGSLLDNRAVSEVDARGTLNGDMPTAGASGAVAKLDLKPGMWPEKGTELRGLMDVPDPSSPGVYKTVLQVGPMGQLVSGVEGAKAQGKVDGGAGTPTNGHPAHVVSAIPKPTLVSGAITQQPGATTIPAPHIADKPREGAINGDGPASKSAGTPVPQAAHVKEGEGEHEEATREEGGPDGYQVSRAVVTFAVLQTEEKTHTIGDDEEGVDENATRAAPFTMASQWQGISALGSSGEEDSADALDDAGPREGGLPRMSKSRSRQLAMSTLADEDDNFDSMARNSLVLLDDKDFPEPLRGSQIFEDDDSHPSQIAQPSKDKDGGEVKVGPPLLFSRNPIPGSGSAPLMKPVTIEQSPKLNLSSPRKMPEKLAKDIGNRIGSPLKQGSGSPTKLLFKMRDSDEKKGQRPVSKLMATGKPPFHHSARKDKSEVSKTSAGGSVSAQNTASAMPNEAHALGTKDSNVASVGSSSPARDRDGSKDAVDAHKLTAHPQGKPVLKDKRLDNGSVESPKELKLVSKELRSASKELKPVSKDPKSILKDRRPESGAGEPAKELKSILKERKAENNVREGSSNIPTVNGTPSTLRDSASRKTMDNGVPHRTSVESKIPVSSSRVADKPTSSEEKRASPPTKIPVRTSSGKSGSGCKRSTSASRLERKSKELADIPECVSPLNLEEDSPMPRPPPGPPRSSAVNVR